MNTEHTAVNTVPVSIERGAFTIKTFCEWASISRSQVYEEIREGRLQTRKLGKLNIIRRADADAWLNALPTAAAA